MSLTESYRKTERKEDARSDPDDVNRRLLTLTDASSVFYSETEASSRR